MAIRIPVGFVAEYRGIQKGGTFKNAAGEQIDYSAKLKFEYEDEDGDVQLLPIGQAQLDRCDPPFDSALLHKGDQVELVGFAVIQDRGADRDSYFAITSCLPAAELAPGKSN